MEEKQTKKFELNTKILENFDQVMATKLDEIEELKITGLDKTSKLLNIISLCANIKTLIIEGDQRINSDKILTNLFHPEKLENLVLNDVKIPSTNSLKKLTNLKMISLNDIRFCQIDKFFRGIVHPEKIEIINISNTDMANNSIEILNEFSKLKYLKLNDLKNGKLNNLQFLRTATNLLKIDIVNTPVAISELNHLIHCTCSKKIAVSITDAKGKEIKYSEFKIEKNISKITILSTDLKKIAEDVNLCRINHINIIINEILQDFEEIHLLETLGNKIHIILNDYSTLNTKQAEKIKDVLHLKKLEFIDEKEKKEIKIEEYIQVRREIENVIERISNHVSKVEKFLEIYQYLGKEFKISEQESDLEKKICTVFEMCQLLQNCLKGIGINSNIIAGEELENDKKHFWNQVELEKKWYNVDLVLDIENLKKNRTEYCLIGDKDFFETHTPKAGKNNYCPEDFNPKLIHVFFKTGLFKEKLIASYIEVVIEKIKKLLNFNKKQEVLALPDKIQEEDKN